VPRATGQIPQRRPVKIGALAVDRADDFTELAPERPVLRHVFGIPVGAQESGRRAQSLAEAAQAVAAFVMVEAPCPGQV
jgi:hypothetical protein